MSLEKWVEYGWLRPEPTSPGEIRYLLGIVERSLADSKVEAVSTDLRFIAALNAAPPELTNQPYTGKYRVREGHLPRFGFKISRSDVADFMIKSVENPVTRAARFSEFLSEQLTTSPALAQHRS